MVEVTYTNNEREIPEFDTSKGSWNWLSSESCGDPQSSIQQQRCYPISPGTLPVEGLESNKDYFVSKIDNKTFQLVEVGIGSTAEMSSGIRTSTLRLILEAMGRSITNQLVTVEGATGVSTLTGQDFNACGSTNC